MQKKKILILPPDTPDPSYITPVIAPLAFLEDEYILHPLDSLTFMDDVPKEEFYRLWHNELEQLIPHYDAFFGFSFGGVILQQCFSLFAEINKPIILFSTPTFTDKALTQKLVEVITLCQQKQIDDALNTLYQYVYYPDEIPLKSHADIDETMAIQRVIYGLSRVLETDSTHLLKETRVKYLHLIGECSQLVNAHNVIAAHQGKILQVPNAGMRMLRNNPLYCKKVIMDALNNER